MLLFSIADTGVKGGGPSSPFPPTNESVAQE